MLSRVERTIREPVCSTAAIGCCARSRAVPIPWRCCTRSGSCAIGWAWRWRSRPWTTGCAPRRAPRPSWSRARARDLGVRMAPAGGRRARRARAGRGARSISFLAGRRAPAAARRRSSDTARAIGARKIALGHQADDQVETILFRILRGTGVRGLAGIPYRREMFVRPLLDVERAQILTYLRRRSIPFVEDPSNRDRALRAGAGCGTRCCPRCAPRTRAWARRCARWPPMPRA